MTSIFFEHTGKAYLPEIPAYISYLKKYYPDVKVLESDSGADIVWRFPGLDRKRSKAFLVHDYNSLSTPPCARLKNSIKKILNIRPQRRVFLNDRVKKDFGFRDDISSFVRDMGVDDSFFRARFPSSYDFVYAGKMDRGPEVYRFLSLFRDRLRDMTILMIGDPPADFHEKFGQQKNIIFAGRMSYAEVPALAAQARYGLNLVPDRYPYNLQASTKLLEYCALGLPVVSNSYGWARDFEKERSARFFWLGPDFTNLTPDSLVNFPFITPDINDLRWDSVIARSRVLDFLSGDTNKHR